MENYHLEIKLKNFIKNKQPRYWLEGKLQLLNENETKIIKDLGFVKGIPKEYIENKLVKHYPANQFDFNIEGFKSLVDNALSSINKKTIVIVNDNDLTINSDLNLLFKNKKIILKIS
jgi:hypothetical protein